MARTPRKTTQQQPDVEEDEEAPTVPPPPVPVEPEKRMLHVIVSRCSRIGGFKAVAHSDVDDLAALVHELELLRADLAALDAVEGRRSPLALALEQVAATKAPTFADAGELPPLVVPEEATVAELRELLGARDAMARRVVADHATNARSQAARRAAIHDHVVQLVAAHR